MCKILVNMIRNVLEASQSDW